MTEIDVPDWVVKAAEDARVHRLNAVTAYGSAGVDERYHMAMRAALTAALGAWVVPVGQAGTMPGTAGFTAAVFKTIDVGVAQPLYTLRQEKPDVLP